LAHMAVWRGGSQRRMEADMRPLVCDYAQFLLYTGIRQGTEAMRLCWHHLAWHWVDGQRYLRVWVDGKTGGRWLIARQAAIEVLERCHQRQQDIQHLSFEELFTQRVRHRVFRFATGYQPRTFIGAFRRLLIDGGLLLDHDGRRRTLYSLRHTYATLALVSGDVDIHTLSRQMGTSVAMLERHYSKLTATMAAARLG
ncbi:MAG: integrase, partial [Actinomycetota bacterium]